MFLIICYIQYNYITYIRAPYFTYLPSGGTGNPVSHVYDDEIYVCISACGLLASQKRQRRKRKRHRNLSESLALLIRRDPESIFFRGLDAKGLQLAS